jgi:hypothetical protein
VYIAIGYVRRERLGCLRLAQPFFDKDVFDLIFCAVTSGCFVLFELIAMRVSCILCEMLGVS